MAPMQAGREGWQRLIIIGLTSFLTLIDLFGAQALLPTLTKAYAVDAATMGVAVNASTIGMAAAGLTVALFSRRIDRKKGIWISLLLLAFPTTGLGLVQSIEAFAALRVAQGVFMSTAFTLTMTYLAEECSASEAAAAMAAYITGNVVSNLLGRMLAASFTELYGLSTNFFLFAGLNILGAVIVFMGIRQAKPMMSDGPILSPFKVWAIHLRNPALRAGFIIGFLILFIFIGVFTYVNYVLVLPPFGVGMMELGLVYLVFLPAIVTTPLAGKMVAKLGVRPAFLASMGLAGAGLALLLTGHLSGVLAGLVLVGVGTFAAQAAATGFVGKAATADRGSASGLYLTCYYLGGLAGSYVIGRLYTTAGWNTCIVAIAAAAMVSCLFAIRLKLPDGPTNTKAARQGSLG